MKLNVIACSLLLSATAFADVPAQFDWPQWQGFDRNAISKEHGLLQEWPKGGPPLAWKIEGLGTGYSGPAVAKGVLYGISNQGDDEIVWALSEADGSTLWTSRLGPALRDGPHQGIEGPGCTPTVEGDRLYVLGAAGTLACLRVNDGKILWQRSLTGDFGGRLPTWRYNESPLIDGDKVICTPGAVDATLVALNKHNGELIWKAVVPEEAEPPAEARPERGRGGRNRGPNSGASYASAIAVDIEGQRQYVQLTATSLVGVAAEDGRLLWRYDHPANKNRINCSTPIFHDGMIFASSAYGNGGGAAKISRNSQGEFQAEEVYFVKNMQNHHGGMIVHDGCLYGAAGGNEGGFLVCLDYKTGKILWRERQAPKGALAFADGRLYLRAESGTLILIEPDGKEFKGRGRFEQPNRTDKPAWTHPVIANGKLYIRDQNTLYCYDVKHPGR